MYKIVTIGEKEVPMLSMASTDLYYKNAFGEDPLKIQTSDDYDAADMYNLFMRMGFIMAKQAEKLTCKDMLKLNEDMFFEWVDQFDREALCTQDKIVEILDVYEGNKDRTSTPKKETDQ